MPPRNACDARLPAERAGDRSGGRRSPWGPRREACVVALLLGTFLLLAGAGALGNSPTVDEFAHLPAGYHYLRTGDFSLYAKNPPLVKILAALPLLAYDPEPGRAFAEEDSSWRPWLNGDDFMRRNAPRYHELFVAGRFVILALGAALGLAVWHAARSLYGPGGGLTALALFCLSPDLLAHAGLVTTDVGATLFIFVAAWAFLSFLDRPGLARGAIAGAALGLALLAKFTALLLVPIFLAGAVAAKAWFLTRHGPGARGFSWAAVAGGVAVLSCASWLILLAGYRFEMVGAPLGELPLRSDLLAALGTALPSLRLPLPRDFLVGLDGQLFETGHYGFSNYLFGTWYEGRRWYYFPVAVLVKTPVPTLAAIAAGPLLWRARRGADGDGRVSSREIALAAAAAFLYLGITVRNEIQIGIRYLLPVYPFAFVLAGRLGSADLLRRGRRRYRGILALGAAVLVAGVLRTFPHYLSYFNVLAGGPERGYRVLLDSNADWGQDLPGLARYMRRHGDRSVHLAYFGPVDPAVYGIAYEPFTRAGQPGLTAISVSYLMGFDFPVTYTTPWRGIPAGETARYRGRTPAGRVGYSILLYRD